MSSWSCPHQVDDACLKVEGAYCRPGMRGCILAGKVQFEDGKIPAPVWMPGRGPRRGERGEGNEAG